MKCSKNFDFTRYHQQISFTLKYKKWFQSIFVIIFSVLFCTCCSSYDQHILLPIDCDFDGRFCQIYKGLHKLFWNSKLSKTSVWNFRTICINLRKTDKILYFWLIGDKIWWSDKEHREKKLNKKNISVLESVQFCDRSQNRLCQRNLLIWTPSFIK